MIFVTVGTHEQQFNRLIKEIDDLVKKGVVKDRVIIQYGYCTYEPKFCECQRFFSFDEMSNLINEADIVLCHGGPATFMSVLNKGKIPIVVPRQNFFGEHINNHQLDFVREVKKRKYEIIVVEDINLLSSAISKNYSKGGRNNSSNNQKFSLQFIKIIQEELIKSDS